MPSPTVKVFTVAADRERRTFLLRNPMFRGLPEAVCDAVVAMTRTRHLTDRSRLFAKGDAPDGMYAVVSGCIRATSSTADGREALLGLMEPGCWFGESSLFDGLPRTYTADAQGECEVLMIPREPLNALLDAQPQLYRHFVPLLCQRIRLSTLLLESNALLSLEGRLAQRLLLLAENVLQGSEEPPRHVLHLSQEDLSQMLGTSRQSINKVLGDWERGGLIERHYGALTLSDPAALRSLCAPP